MCFRPCKPSQWKQSLKIQVFLWLFLLVRKLYYVVHTRPEFLKELLRCSARAGMGVRGYWSVQMAVTVWWGLSQSERERKNGARNNKDAHLHTLQNAFLLSCNPGMGGLPGELRAHPSSYQSALSPGSHLLSLSTTLRTDPLTQILVLTHIWNGWSMLGCLKVQHLSAATQ